MATLNQYQVRHWRCKGQKCWKQLPSSITCRDKKSIKTVWVCTFLSLEIRARVAQRWNHSPPTNVARVQIPAWTLYVGWVCCWFSPLRRRFSPGTPVFPSPQKLTFPNSNSTRNQVDKEPLCGCATFKSLSLYLLRGYLIIFVFRMSFQLETFVIFF